MHKRLGRHNRGLTLLELVVAIFVLSIGSIAALKGVDQARRGIGEDSARLLAQVVARNRAEELQFLGMRAGGNLPSQVVMGPYMFTITTSTKTTSAGLIRAEITARAQTGPGAFYVTFLPPVGAGG